MEQITTLENIDAPIIKRKHKDDAGKVVDTVEYPYEHKEAKKGPLSGVIYFAPKEPESEEQRQKFLDFLGVDNAFDILYNYAQREAMQAHKHGTDYDVKVDEDGKKVAVVKDINTKKIVQALESGSMRGETKKELEKMLAETTMQLAELSDKLMDENDVPNIDIMKKVKYLSQKVKTLRDNIDQRSRKKDDDED